MLLNIVDNIKIVTITLRKYKNIEYSYNIEYNIACLEEP